MGSAAAELGEDQQAAVSRRRILDHIAKPRLHHRHRRIDQGSRRDLLAGSRCLPLMVLLQHDLLKVAQPLMTGAARSQVVDIAHQLA